MIIIIPITIIKIIIIPIIFVNLKETGTKNPLKAIKLTPPKRK